MKTTLSERQEDFLDDEYWVLTFGGAFQRANIYLPVAKENERSEFRQKLKWVVKVLVSRQYYGEVTPEKHIENIKEISKGTMHFGHILQNGRINFGVAQKLLNLYLKYLWCAGKIPTPPHFPIDRMIQEITKYKPVFSWTRMFDETDYLKLINFAESQLKEDESLAGWELRMFNRRAI